MRLVVVALAFISFVACDKQYEDLTLHEDLSVSGEVTFVASLREDANSTRVESNIWESEDFIGISTINESEQNMLYSVEANGTMTNTDEDVVIGVLDNNSYYAYYPYDKSLSDGVKSISLLDQDLAESLTSYDLMWASQENIGASQPTVYLYFERQLVHLDVTFCLIDSYFDTSRSIKLNGVTADGIFNIMTGELTPNESVGTINLNVKSTNETYVTIDGGSNKTLTTIRAEAIVLPMSDSDIYFSYVTTEGGTIVCCFNDVSWDKGYSYNYTISEQNNSYSLSEISAGSYPSGNLWIINDTQPNSSSDFNGLCEALETVSSESSNIHLYFPNLTVLPKSAMCDCGGYFALSMPSLTKVNSSALQGCSKLTTIDAPNLEYVGDFAFYGCSALTTISADNVSIIDDYAFKSCSALESLSLPNLLSSGTEAFSYCSNLTGLSAPLLSWVGNSMLSSADKITDISIGYESERGITYLTKEWLNGVVTDDINLVISSIMPSGVSVSGNTITYADGTQTFKNIDNKALTLSLFSSGMDTSDLSNTTWAIVDYNSDGSYSSGDFAGLRDVLNSRKEPVKLSFPYIENLPDDALKDCSNISSIELLSVKSVGSGSLSGCSSLSEITLGSASNYISEIKSGWVDDTESEAIDLTINSGFSSSSFSIDGNRLYNDGSYIYFKTLNGEGFSLNSFKEMGEGTLSYPKSTEWYITESGAPSSEEYDDLQDIMSSVGEPISLTFSDITTLSRDALSETDNLYKITLETATKVNYMALESCSSLEIIDMPNVTTVSNMAFAFCSKLKVVSLPSALVLGPNLFQTSMQMESMDIGSKITTPISSYDNECFASMFNVNNIDLTICVSNQFTSDMSVDIESNKLIFSSATISEYRQYIFKSITQQ